MASTASSFMESHRFPVALLFCRAGSGDKRLVLRSFALAVIGHRAPGTRQLQHRRALALAKIGHQHDLSVREFQGIVVSRRPVEIDLPKTRNFVRRLARRQEPE